jgi:putative addiction module killer protein
MVISSLSVNPTRVANGGNGVVKARVDGPNAPPKPLADDAVLERTRPAHRNRSMLTIPDPTRAFAGTNFTAFRDGTRRRARRCDAHGRRSLPAAPPCRFYRCGRAESALIARAGCHATDRSRSSTPAGRQVAPPTPVNYSSQVSKVVRGETFDRWLRKLKDRRAAARVLVPIDRLGAGNPGDVKPVGEGISELRINYGPGYRVYYLRDGDKLIVLLCGGDKSTQGDDIKNANRIAKEWKETMNDDRHR